MTLQLKDSFKQHLINNIIDIANKEYNLNLEHHNVGEICSYEKFTSRYPFTKEHFCIFDNNEVSDLFDNDEVNGRYIVSVKHPKLHKGKNLYMLVVETNSLYSTNGDIYYCGYYAQQ